MGVKLEGLRLGDIIIHMQYGETPAHAMLWVGGEKPIAHAADENIKAVVVNRVSPELFRDPKVGHYVVYRHPKEEVGRLAAKFAGLWAQPSKDQLPQCKVVTPYGRGRYNVGRYLHSDSLLGEDWDVTATRLLEQFGPNAGDKTAYGRAIGLTEGLMFDAKYSSIDYLLKRLENPSSSFAKAGVAIPIVVPGSRARAVFLLPIDKYVDSVKQSTISQLLADKILEPPA